MCSAGGEEAKRAGPAADLQRAGRPLQATPPAPALAKHMPVSPHGQAEFPIVDAQEPSADILCSLPFGDWMRSPQSRPAATSPLLSSLHANVMGLFKAGGGDGAHTHNAGFVAKVKEDVRAVNRKISATAPLSRRSSSFTVSAHLFLASHASFRATHSFSLHSVCPNRV